MKATLISRILTRGIVPRQAVTPQFVFLVALPVLLQLHLGLRLLEGESLRWDECEQTLFSQKFALGYNDQPPVYTWLLKVFMQFTGVSLVGVYLFKSIILAAIYLGLYRLSRRLMPDRYAIPAALSLLLTPYFAWSAMMDGAHTPFVTMFAPLLLLIVFRVLERPTATSFALLGLVLGFGFLAKYSFVLLGVALPAAMLTIPEYRARLRDPRLILTVIVGFLVVLPHARWVLEHWASIRARPMERGGISSSSGLLVRSADGLGSLGMTVLLTAGPLIAAFLIFFRGACIRIFTERAASDETRLVGRWLVIVGGSLIVLIFLGVTRFRTHWLIPALVIVPAYVFARFAEAPPSKWRIRAFVVTTMLALVSVVGVRVGRIASASQEGGKEWARDRVHGAISAHVDAACLGDATFLGDCPLACGNLRLRHPQAKVACIFYPAYLPVDLANISTCYFVWDATLVDRPFPPSQDWIKAHGLTMDDSAVFFAEMPCASCDKNLRRIGMIRLTRR